MELNAPALLHADRAYKSSPPALIAAFLCQLDGLVFCLLVAITVLGAANGQPANIYLEGRVVDASGATVSRARVTLGSEDHARPRAIISTEPDGEFSISLPPGTYLINIAADGFATYEQTLRLDRPLDAPLDFELQIAPQSQTVTVTESTGYKVVVSTSALKTPTPLLNVPQS